MDNRKPVFDQLKSLLKAYQPPLVCRKDGETEFDLWSEKDLVIEGRKRKEIFFAGLSIHKEYVGFYFMPVYADGDLVKVFRPELLHLLKGKSCFHVKQLDEALAGQVRQALAAGYNLYKERGWV